MGYRRARQTIAVLVVLVVLGGISFAFYRANAPAPTCTDGKKNQNETDVDCDGECIPCAYKTERPLINNGARFVSSSSGVFDIAASITNPNERLAARFDYRIVLTAGEATTIDSQRGSGYIYPKETTHVAVFGLRPKNIPTGAKIELSNMQFEYTDEKAPDVVAGNKESAIDLTTGRRSVVTANLVNRSFLDVAPINVLAVIEGSGGELLGVHQTHIDRLPGNASVSLRFVWPTVFALPVASITIEARSPGNLPDFP